MPCDDYQDIRYACSALGDINTHKTNGSFQLLSHTAKRTLLGRPQRAAQCVIVSRRMERRSKRALARLSAMSCFTRDCSRACACCWSIPFRQASKAENMEEHFICLAFDAS